MEMCFSGFQEPSSAKGKPKETKNVKQEPGEPCEAISLTKNHDILDNALKVASF